MKIGILGGSFDPIHNGHLNMAKQALQEYQLDEVWLMPAGHSPNKIEADMTPAAIRYEMTKLAAETQSKLAASDFELQKKSTSYTYQTLELLQARYPNHTFYFIMGADSLDYFEQWAHPDIICKYAVILVVNRDSFQEEELSRKIQEIQKMFYADIRIVHCTKMDVSSREIRQKISLGDTCRNLVPENVWNYITANHLYGV